MKRVYELDVDKLAEDLSDMIWYDFDKWSNKVQKIISALNFRHRRMLLCEVSLRYEARVCLRHENAFINSTKTCRPNS